MLIEWDNTIRIARNLCLLTLLSYMFQSLHKTLSILQKFGVFWRRAFNSRQLFVASLLSFCAWYDFDTVRGLRHAIFHVYNFMGRATLVFYHSNHKLSMCIKGGSQINFADLCRDVIAPCHLHPLLFNGHLQTIWNLFPHKDIEIYYKRSVLHNTDPIYAGSFAVDFVTSLHAANDLSLPPRTIFFTEEEIDQLKSSDTKPMLVLLHGLTGGSHELYLKEVLAPLVSEAGGWEACVVNSRGCANSNVTSSQLYNARSTWDIRKTIDWLRDRFPNRRLFGVGFSLGGNILTNYLAEEGLECPLKAAVVISNPWNLEVCSLALQRSMTGLHIYSRAMGKYMLAVFESQMERLIENPHIDIDEVRKAKYIHEFDRSVQRQTWGYPTEGAYYRDASSIDSLLAVRVPLLALHAEDDPIATNEALPRNEVQQTPYVFLCTTSLGGHLGWFSVYGQRWYVKTASSFLQRLAQEIDFEQTPHPDAEFQGYIRRDDHKPLIPAFEPTRSKLYIPETTESDTATQKSYSRRPSGQFFRRFTTY